MVDGNGSSRDEAYAEAAHATTAVDEVLGVQGDALARVMTAALIVPARARRWQDGEAVRTGWTASRTSVLEVRALERLATCWASWRPAAQPSRTFRGSWMRRTRRTIRRAAAPVRMPAAVEPSGTPPASG